MKLPKLLSTLVLLIFAIASLTAQSYSKILNQMSHKVNGYGTPLAQAFYSNYVLTKENVNQIKNRKLIVAIAQPDDEMLDKLKNEPELTATYKYGIWRANKNMQEAINKFWKTGKNIEYKTPDEIASIQNKADYLVAFAYTMTTAVHTLDLPIYKSTLAFSVSTLAEDSLHNVDIESNASQFAIATLEDNVIIYSQVVPDLFPTKADVAITLAHIMQYCNGDSTDYRKSSSEFLKNKSLLVRKDWLDDRFLKENEIKAIYPYPYKLVSRDELDQAIMSVDTQYVFIYFNILYISGSADYTVENAGGYSFGGSDTHTVSGYATYKPTDKEIICNKDLKVLRGYKKAYSRIVKNYVLLPDDFKSWFPAPKK